MISMRSSLFSLTALCAACASSSPDPRPVADDPDPSFVLTSLSATYRPELDAVVLGLSVAGDAASVVPTPAGQVDGAPVLAYVFTTDLDAADVGFSPGAGTVALAVTSHPDFDDTPLWDEDDNARYDDDGAVYHAHWVVLVEDARAPAGLAARQAGPEDRLPPTAPMPMFLDSPGFTVIEDGAQLRVVVPADRVRRKLSFRVGAQTARLQVDASGATPLLAVHEVYDTLEGGAPTLAIADAARAPASAWPAPTDDAGALDVDAAEASYLASLDTFVFSMRVASGAGTRVPTPAGAVDGAPVLGYVFPTDLPPAAVGFSGIEGTLVLAVTSHPDFDDTPLWDEDLDGAYDDDGAVYHVHWAVLVADEASAAGLSVPSQADPAQLPPTAPMPMYLDSPGYHAFASGDAVHVLVPGWHLGGARDFRFDALTASMRVDASGPGPVLRVETVHEVLSGDLSLPLRPSVRP